MMKVIGQIYNVQPIFLYLFVLMERYNDSTKTLNSFHLTQDNKFQVGIFKEFLYIQFRWFNDICLTLFDELLSSWTRPQSSNPEQ